VDPYVDGYVLKPQNSRKYSADYCSA